MRMDGRTYIVVIVSLEECSKRTVVWGGGGGGIKRRYMSKSAMEVLMSKTWRIEDDLKVQSTFFTFTKSLEQGLRARQHFPATWFLAFHISLWFVLFVVVVSFFLKKKLHWEICYLGLAWKK